MTIIHMHSANMQWRHYRGGGEEAAAPLTAVLLRIAPLCGEYIRIIRKIMQTFYIVNSLSEVVFVRPAVFHTALIILYLYFTSVE